jgi:uncharacterized membrane protein
MNDDKMKNLFQTRVLGKLKNGKLVLPVLFFFVAWIALSASLVPTKSLFTFILLALSVAAGLLLYIGGLLLCVFAFKRAHELFRKQEQEWHGSLSV